MNSLLTTRTHNILGLWMKKPQKVVDRLLRGWQYFVLNGYPDFAFDGGAALMKTNGILWV